MQSTTLFHCHHVVFFFLQLDSNHFLITLYNLLKWSYVTPLPHDTGNHRYEDHHQHLSLLQTNTFHSVNFGHLQLANVLQNEVRLDLGLGLDESDSQGQGLEDNNDSRGQGLGSLTLEKQQTNPGKSGLGVGVGSGLAAMLREEMIGGYVDVIVFQTFK